jgi:hypothetical protein
MSWLLPPLPPRQKITPLSFAPVAKGDQVATRVEELTLRLADGDLTGDEERELDALLASDAAARETHHRLLRLEAELRAAHRPSLLAPVMNAVRTARRSGVVRTVMEEVRARPPARRRRRLRWALAAVAVAVLALLLLRRDRPGVAPPPAVALARVLATQGQVTRAGAPLGSGATLAPGDEIACAADSSADLELHGARLRLAEARLALGPADLPEQVLRATQGTVAAEVPPQPPGHALVFLTPHARAVVLGTRLRLTVAATSTELVVDEGRVLFIRLHDGSTTEVAAGQRTLATAAPPPSPAPATPLGADVVFAYDFEDGALPPLFELGYPTPGPPRPGNHFALVGAFNYYGPRPNTVTLERYEPALFRYDARQVLTFDYWLGADGHDIKVQLWNPDARDNYHHWLTSPPRETWTHAVVRLADMAPEKSSGRPLRAGDRIRTISILGGRISGKPLYVDNLELRAYPPTAVPASSAGSRYGDW